MADEHRTPEERADAAREEAGRELLALIRQDRQRRAAMRQWLRESIEAGYEAREAERRQRDEER